MSATARSVVASSRSSVARLVRERLCGCALLVLDQKLEGEATTALPALRGPRAAGSGDSKVKEASLAWFPRRALLCATSRPRALSMVGVRRHDRNETAARVVHGLDVGGRTNLAGSRRGRVYGEASRLAWKRNMRHRRRHGEAAKIMHGVKLSSLTYRAWKTSTTCPHAC